MPFKTSLAAVIQELQAGALQYMIDSQVELAYTNEMLRRSWSRGGSLVWIAAQKYSERMN